MAVIGFGVLLTVAGGCDAPVDPVAATAFRESLGNTSITVFPAFVRRGDPDYDENAAATLAAFFEDEGLAEVSVSDAEVPIPGPWRANQARILEESAAAFASYLSGHPLQTDYGLLPEYFQGGRGAFVGVHCYIVDRDSRWAFAVLQNSHWPVFQKVDPQTTDDCTTILIEVLREELVSDRSEE
jgi:hypothetical protein